MSSRRSSAVPPGLVTISENKLDAESEAGPEVGFEEVYIGAAPVTLIAINGAVTINRLASVR